VDRDLYLRLNDLARSTAWAHPFMRSFARYGIVLFPVLFLWSWWIGRTESDSKVIAAAVWAAAACLLAVALAQPIVNAVDRSRPYAHDHGALVLADRTTDPSFPSDHSTIAGAAAAGLWFTRRRRVRVSAIGLAAAMAFARVYVGAHYPGDVLGGLAFGAAVGALGGWLLVTPISRGVDWVATTGLRRLVVPGSEPEPERPRVH
jgi:undecaprenyl-diphosphatase